jgi:uncharacterized membrane protein (DUF4010 family)
VTASFSGQSKKRPEVTGILSVGMMLALGVMEHRILFEIYLIGGAETKGLFLLIPGIMGVFSLAYAGFMWKTLIKQKEKNIETKSIEFKIKSPFHILPALKFGGIFVSVLFAIAAGKHLFGDMGVYVAAFLSGLVDVDAVVLSSLESVRLGELSLDVAKNAIFIALVVNTLIKVAYTGILGSRKLLKQISLGVVLTSLVGAVVFWLV